MEKSLFSLPKLKTKKQKKYSKKHKGLVGVSNVAFSAMFPTLNKVFSYFQEEEDKKNQESSRENSIKKAEIQKDAEKVIIGFDKTNDLLEISLSNQEKQNEILSEIIQKNSLFNSSAIVDEIEEVIKKLPFPSLDKLKRFRIPPPEEPIPEKPMAEEPLSEENPKIFEDILNKAKTGANRALKYGSDLLENLELPELGEAVLPEISSLVGAGIAIPGIAFGIRQAMPEENPQDRTRFGPQDLGESNLEILRDIEPFKAGDIVSSEQLRQTFGYSKEEWDKDVYKQFLESKQIKKIPNSVKKTDTKPNIFDNKNNIFDKIIFDADRIIIEADKFNYGQTTSSNRPNGIRGMGNVGAGLSLASYSPGEPTQEGQGGGISSGGTGNYSGDTTALGGPPITGGQGLTREVGKEELGNAEDIINFFMSKGWSREQAAGIAGNLQVESGFKTNATGDNGEAYGIAQWHPDRQADFEYWAGKDIRQSSLKEQLEFMNFELTSGREKKAGNAILQAKTPSEAAKAVDDFYERSNKAAQRERMDLAETYFKGQQQSTIAQQKTDGVLLNNKSIQDQAANSVKKNINAEIPDNKLKPSNSFFHDASYQQEEPDIQLRFRQLMGSA
jgi:hypothetical protein